MRDFLHWFFEKISMVYLAVFVLFHIVMVHWGDEVCWQTIAARLKESPKFFTCFYTISLALILYHALTRIWEMLIEYNLWPKSKHRKITKRALWMLAGTLIILASLALQPFLGG